MMRFVRGTVLLGVSAFLWACSSESTQYESGGPDHMVIDPSVLFINQGDSQAVLIRLVDKQSQALQEAITISDVGAGIAVVPDSAFRPIFDADGNLVFNKLNTEIRVYVKANDLVGTTFKASAAGKEGTANVTVMPTSLDAVVSGSPADIGTPITITAPAGLTFGANAAVVDAGGNTIAYVLSISGDGTSMQVLPIPGAALADFTVRDVHPSYAPSLSLNLASTADLELTGSVGPGLAGTDAEGTAPAIPLATDVARGVVDAGNFAGVAFGLPTQFYTITVAADGTFDFNLAWAGGQDLGIYLSDGTGIADSFGEDPGASPETAEGFELAAGTYVIAIINFSATNPEYFDLTVTQR